LKTQIYEILSGLTIFAYFLPLVILLSRKLWKEKPLLLFGIYWTLNGLVNGIKRFDLVTESAKQFMTVAYNLIDMPLVLFFVFLSTT
jgi:hypothetical protein